MKIYLQELHLNNFKNYALLRLVFHSKLNIITGLNGAGKTNLLDAIYYLCFCKSHFSSSDTGNILHDTAFFRIEGFFVLDKKTEKVTCAFAKGGRGKRKVVEHKGIPYEKLSEHIGFCPLIMIAPDDIEIVKGGSTERRKLMDTCLAQYKPTYLQYLMDYNRVRKQRNATLKQFAKSNNFDRALLQTYDEQLVHYGKYLVEQRQLLWDELQVIFQDIYQQLTIHVEKTEVVQFHYLSVLKTMDFTDLLKKNQERDRINQRTTEGVHTDDWEFEIGEHALKKLGSQGQQKTFLIALKLSIYHLLQSKMEKTPILLLDDVFDKLDEKRIRQLLKMVTQEHFGQIFITDTSGQRLQSILNELNLEHTHIKIMDGLVET